jgi:hypothetical protein
MLHQRFHVRSQKFELLCEIDSIGLQLSEISLQLLSHVLQHCDFGGLFYTKTAHSVVGGSLLFISPLFFAECMYVN